MVTGMCEQRLVISMVIRKDSWFWGMIWQFAQICRVQVPLRVLTRKRSVKLCFRSLRMTQIRLGGLNVELGFVGFGNITFANWRSFQA